MKYLSNNYNESEIKIDDIIIKCAKLNIKKYDINDKFEINVYEDVDISCMRLRKIPLNFKEVFGTFNCSYNNLFSLINSPIIIHKDFIFSNNMLEDLSYCPKEISNDMYGHGNTKLTVLKKFPEFVGGDVDLSDCALNSLHKCLSVVYGSFNVSLNKKLSNLKYGPQHTYADYICSKCNLTTLHGSPVFVGGTFDCSFNNITELKYSPNYIGLDFIFNNNKISSFYNFPEYVGGVLYCKNNPIYSIWKLFEDKNQIDYFNQLKIIKDYNKININKLNIFLKTIDGGRIDHVEGYNTI